MIPISSRLEGHEEGMADVRAALEERGFVVGGNWDYDHGCLDKALDEGRKVWLRIPFQVTAGEFDAAGRDTTCRIRLGTPFVLKHAYEENDDRDANMQTFGGLVNQFQEPVDRDARVAPHWLEQGKKALREAEQALLRRA